MVVTSPSKKEIIQTYEFFDSALTGFGLGTKDIESTQGRLTLHGFTPFYKRAKAIISSDRKREGEIACKIFKLKGDVLEGDVEFLDVNTSTKSSAKSAHNNALSHFHAIILCTNKPEETIARYCWLTDQSSPRRIFGSSWQVGPDQQKIIVCSEEDVENLFLA